MPAPTASARRARVRWALIVLAATVGSVLVDPSSPARAADPPSWADVQDARADEARTRVLVARIESALADAEARAASTSRDALTAAATASAAREAADAATARADALQAAATEAEARLSAARDVLGDFASRLYRVQADGPLVARLLTSAEPESLLSRLGLLDKLSTGWARTAGAAQRDALSARSLRDQAVHADAARTEAASAAERTAAQARSAADAEAALLAGVQDEVTELYAQLAALKDTTADTERRYRLGRQVAAQPAPSAPAGGTGSGGGSSSGGGSAGVGSPSGGGSAGAGSSSGGGSGGSGFAPDGTPTWGVSVDPAGAREYARGAIAAYGWGEDQFGCLVLLWNRESGWRANALNPSSGAYGIPQALPAEKMAAAGADWRTNGNTQVNWGLSYIRSRYGSPCGAWDHSQRVGWY